MSGTNAPPGPQPAVDSKLLWRGGRLIIFVCLALVAAMAWVMFKGQSGYQPPLSIGILMGFVLLIAMLAGLVLIFETLGLTSPNDAFGLPAGSIRALLALALVIVFVAVGSAELAPGAAVTDLSKQILTISATALTTVVGFYFGSNSATDAMGKAQAQSAAPALDAAPVPPTVAAIAGRAAAVKAAADALRATWAAATPRVDDIAAAHPGLAGLDGLRTQATACAAAVTAASVDSDRAQQAAADAQTAGGDAKTLQAAADRLTQLAADCASEQAAFNKALVAFTSQRETVLKPVAQG